MTVHDEAIEAAARAMWETGREPPPGHSLVLPRDESCNEIGKEDTRRIAGAVLAAVAALPGDDPREFVLWADHTWTGGNEESDEIENASLNVVPKPLAALWGDAEPTEAMIEAAILAAYNDQPQWYSGTMTRPREHRPKTFEECYGCKPLEHAESVKDAQIVLRAALAARSVGDEPA